MHAAVTLAPTMPAPGPGMLLWPDPLSCSYQFSIEAALDLHREKRESLSVPGHKNVPVCDLSPRELCTQIPEVCPQVSHHRNHTLPKQHILFPLNIVLHVCSESKDPVLLQREVVTQFCSIMIMRWLC